MGLKELREKHGFTQIKIASLAGIYHPRMSTLEHEYFPMTEKEKGKIVAAYNSLGVDATKELEEIYKGQNKNVGGNE